MAKLEKQRLDFFPFDTDFFEDEKIVAISSEFGIKGEITAVKLLCEVYRNGYYLTWSQPARIKLVSKLKGVSPCLLDDIVRRLVKWGFFDKSLFDSANILTSRGIQIRYFSPFSNSFRKNLPYLLIEDAKTQVIAAKTKSKEAELPFEGMDDAAQVIATETPVIGVKTAETGIFAAKTPINAAISTPNNTIQYNTIEDSLRSSLSTGEPLTQQDDIDSPIVEDAQKGDERETIDFSAFKDFFNSKVQGTSVPSIVSLKSEMRRGLLRARVKEHGKDSLAVVVQKVVDSTFLTGGTGQFVAKFDWIFRPQNFLKILEGNYDDNLNQTANGYGTNSNIGYRPVAKPTAQQRIDAELERGMQHLAGMLERNDASIRSSVPAKVW